MLKPQILKITSLFQQALKIPLRVTYSMNPAFKSVPIWHGLDKIQENELWPDGKVDMSMQQEMAE